METLTPADFDFNLPPELIAQQPAARREDSRLLVLDRASRGTRHRKFLNLLEYLGPGDALVLNDSKVIPARLRARHARTKRRFEVLLVEENGVNDWWAMVRPGKRAPAGAVLEIMRGGETVLTATVTDVNAEGHRRLRVAGGENILARLEELGEVPLPPYIERAAPHEQDRERYQTVYAHAAGSVAAPTAGLHFTTDLLERVKQKKVAVSFVTLHVGLGTFAPVKTDTLAGHVMHEERFVVSPETARTIAETKAAGGRLFAVGTTTLRVLESVAAEHDGIVAAGAGRTRLFAYPPFNFRAVDALLTNFHLPRSTLLMLVSAFASPGRTDGRAWILQAYREAARERYRFFSYGDAMLLI